jgi:hypothetical protein
MRSVFSLFPATVINVLHIDYATERVTAYAQTRVRDTIAGCQLASNQLI